MKDRFIFKIQDTTDPQILGVFSINHANVFFLRGWVYVLTDDETSETVIRHLRWNQGISIYVRFQNF